MTHTIGQSRFGFATRFISSFIILTFLWTTILPPSYAQTIGLNLPVPGSIVQPSPAFVPVLLKGLTVHPEDPFQFDFIIDTGNTDFTKNNVEDESERLIKYFLASMTVPERDLWVNLSPYEADRVIPEELSKTELGRDLLAQDYLLKQFTASLMHPEKGLGERFWDRVSAKAQEKFGTINIPVETFNKVWILPDSATVYEHGQTVYIVKSHLKVMLDSDYLAMSQQGQDAMSQEQKLKEELMREIIVPEIEREVNEGMNFAPLRQIYHSLILAQWYKETIQDSLLSRSYVDQNKIKGIDVQGATFKEDVYTQYMQAYKKGVFQLIREEYDQLADEIIPRAYFSGGFKSAKTHLNKGVTAKDLTESVVGEPLNVKVDSNDPTMVSNSEEVSDTIEKKEISSGKKGPDQGVDKAIKVWNQGDYAIIISWIAHGLVTAGVIVHALVNPIPGLALGGHILFLGAAANFALMFPGVNALITIVVPQITYPFYLASKAKKWLKERGLDPLDVYAMRKVYKIEPGDIIETMNQYDDVGLRAKDFKLSDFNEMAQAVVKHDEEKAKRVIKEAIAKGLPKLREELSQVNNGKDFPKKTLKKMHSGEVVKEWVRERREELGEQERKVRIKKAAALKDRSPSGKKALILAQKWDTGEAQGVELNAAIDAAASTVLEISVSDLNKMSSDKILAKWNDKALRYLKMKEGGWKVKGEKDSAGQSTETMVAASSISSQKGSDNSPSEKGGTDAAMLTKGGIDMNDIPVDRSGNGVDIRFAPEALQPAAEIDGYAPVIINITPINNILMMLGFADQEPDHQYSKVAAGHVS